MNLYQDKVRDLQNESALARSSRIDVLVDAAPCLPYPPNNRPFPRRMIESVTSLTPRHDPHDVMAGKHDNQRHDDFGLAGACQRQPFACLCNNPRVSQSVNPTISTASGIRGQRQGTPARARGQQILQGKLRLAPPPLAASGSSVSLRHCRLGCSFLLLGCRFLLPGSSRFFAGSLLLPSRMNRQSGDGADAHENQYEDENFVRSHTCPP